jgi:hypothetical protein
VGKYKFGRVLAGWARIFGVLFFIPAVIILFTGPGALSALPIAAILFGVGLALALAGTVAHAVFDASEAVQRGFPVGEPNGSLKRTDQSLRD